jgi:integrase
MDEKRYTYEQMLRHPSIGKIEGRYERVKNHPGIFRYIGTGGFVSYGISWYTPDGKQHREMIHGGLREAKEELGKKREMAKRGIVINRRITFREVAQKYARLQAGKSSFENSQKYFLGYWKKNDRKEEEWQDMILTKHFGDYKLCGIGTLDIETFKRQRAETKTKSGKVRTGIAINRELELLRSVLNKAKEWGYLDQNPFSRFQKSIMEPEDHGRVRYLTEDEIKALLAACPDYLGNIVRAALLTGLRKGDVLSLKWEDVDLEKGILFFNEEKKRGRRQVKILNDDMVNLLMGIPKGKSDHIFTYEGKPLKDVQRSFRTALKKAKIENFHFHDLRHCSASLLAQRGVGLQIIQRHLGHSSISMTQRYSHLSDAALKEGIDKLNGLFGEATA